MTNTNIGRAEKGSRHCIQEYMEYEKRTLTSMIIAASPSLLAFNPADIDWLSPLPNQDFKEYKDDFLKPLELTEKEKLLREFWPKNGPQWDGLARIIGNYKQGVLLVEAKAHPDETKSDMGASSKRSIALIKKSIQETQEFIGVKSTNWEKNTYQFANRLAYLYFFNEILKIPTWLTMINFTDDHSHVPTAINEWQTHYSSIFQDMGFNSDNNLIDKIIMIFPKALNKNNNKHNQH